MAELVHGNTHRLREIELPGNRSPIRHAVDPDRLASCARVRCDAGVIESQGREAVGLTVNEIPGTVSDHHDQIVDFPVVISRVRDTVWTVVVKLAEVHITIRFVQDLLYELPKSSEFCCRIRRV